MVNTVFIFLKAVKNVVICNYSIFIMDAPAPKWQKITLIQSNERGYG